MDRRSWVRAALPCVALLVAPGLVLLMAPGRPPGSRPRSVASVALANPRSPARVEMATLAAHRQDDAGVPSSGPAAGPIEGIVVDPGGRPLSQATVACDDRDRGPTASSNDEGRFTLPPEAAGCLAVARHGGFVASSRTQLVAGRRNTLELHRGGAIEGAVVDEREAPIASYTLAVESYRGTSADAVPGTPRPIHDAQGVFILDRLPPGTYVLTVSGVDRPPARSQSIAVDMDRTTSHVRITLAVGGVLVGQIVDGDTRKPVAGATVALDAVTLTGANAIAAVSSDNSGAYTLRGAPADLFSIRVSHPSYLARTVPGLAARGSVPVRQDVDLHALTDGGPREEFAGIGAVLAQTPQGVVVREVIVGGPAAGAGLLAGDMIRRIDGADAEGWPAAACIQRLRGPEGSTVLIQVDRSGVKVDAAVARRLIAR